MNGSTVFDYYYGDESSQFSFYRIPRQLITGQQFKKVSTDAKLLYGLLLDRMGLSARNSWYDDAGRVYIFYTLDEIQEDLNCGHEKAVKLLSELDTDKGCGLIERMKQGQGKPTKIYVKRFTTRQVTAETIVPQEVPRLPKIVRLIFLLYTLPVIQQTPRCLYHSIFSMDSGFSLIDTEATVPFLIFTTRSAIAVKAEL